MENQVLHVHKPVMLKEVLEFLAPAPGRRFLDVTVGAGGHGGSMLKEIQPGGLLVGLDRDPAMLSLAFERFHDMAVPEASWRLCHLSYKDMDQALEEAGLMKGGVDGILFDLGLSSVQLDDPSRGFSMYGDGPLDFRFDRSQSLAGTEVVNEWQEAELQRIFREYADERFARAIARRICQMRVLTPIQTTTQLADIVKRAIPPRYRTTRRHPATLVFQAIRIAVNKEFEDLKQGLSKALSLLAPGGVCVVLSYHSGEDRIVKQSFKKACARSGGMAEFESLTKKPLVPSPEETRENPRARSAKLRAIRRRPVSEECFCMV
jgi:16S rRNA (cytosine1402-N4)-methyltransferase